MSTCEFCCQLSNASILISSDMHFYIGKQFMKKSICLRNALNLQSSEQLFVFVLVACIHLYFVQTWKKVKNTIHLLFVQTFPSLSLHPWTSYRAAYETGETRPVIYNIYYYYVLACGVLFLTESVALFLSQNQFWMVYFMSLLTSVQCGIFDNLPLIWAFQEHPFSRSSIYRSGVASLISFSVYAVYLVWKNILTYFIFLVWKNPLKISYLQLTVNDRFGNCTWCHLYIPNPQM